MKSPLVIAVIGVVVTIVLYMLCGKLTNKVFKGIGQIGAVIAGLVAVAGLAPDTKIAGTASQFWFLSIVVLAVVSKLFGGSRR